jgi:hypothetical protein
MLAINPVSLNGLQPIRHRADAPLTLLGGVRRPARFLTASRSRVT